VPGGSTCSVFHSIPLGGHEVRVVEGREVEALAEDEDAGDEVAAAAGKAEGGVVAAGAGARVHGRDAVEGAGKDQGVVQARR